MFKKANNHGWGFVFDKDRCKLTKYFKREINSPVYIRLYLVNKDGKDLVYFQMSGDSEVFSSIPVKEEKTLTQIKEDFPFIKNYTFAL